MASPFEKLERILLLEQEQGYRNHAVIGGLERFLRYWEKEAHQESAAEQEPLVNRILESLSNYDTITRDQRRNVIETAFSLLEKAETSKAGEPETASPSPNTAEAGKTPKQPQRPVASKASSDVTDTIGPLDVPVTRVRGISAKIAPRLARLGITTVGDLLYHLPRRYDDYGKLKPINRLQLDDEITIVGCIRNVRTRRTLRGQTLISIVLSDGTGTIEATWFNQPYLERSFKPGREIVLSGRVSEYLGRLVFNSPEWEPLRQELLHTKRLVPVYPLTAGISARQMRRIVKNALDRYVDQIIDPLPPEIISSAGLMELPQAIRQIHYPDNRELLEKARRRLCFDEFFMLQLGVLQQRQRWQSQRGLAIEIPEARIQDFIQGLPFELTHAQRRAIETILRDLRRPVPMSRLLQGDVGSGKTIVAIVAMLAIAYNGLQTAFMAPTAILAEQHFRSVQRYLGEQTRLRCALLIGDLPARRKAELLEEIANGRVQVVVGTHALIQESVEFHRLGLVIVDEQHRFGVAQRGALRDKAPQDVQPHMLAMSATPIPRTLALTMYGDLDISVLDEMPPGRQKVLTAVRTSSSRERIYSFIRSQVRKGRQAFIICPLVEDTEQSESKAAVSEHERLQKEVFPDLRLGLLHGRMSVEEKDAVMSAFKEGAYDILVSTAVVEVGIDVPNATVILIEGAERFGLAQLHQFRGRVGRGPYKSYCVLLSDSNSEQSLERLRIMEETNNGFVLAEKDLQMRGPGDFFGVRQHGLPQLKVASLGDTAILELAREQAARLIERDPNLEQPQHRALAMSTRRFWRQAELS